MVHNQKLTFWPVLGLIAIASLAVVAFSAEAEDEDLFFKGFQVQPRYPLVNEDTQINITAFTNVNGTSNVTVDIFEKPVGETSERNIYSEILDSIDSKGTNIIFNYFWPDNQSGDRQLRAVIDLNDTHSESNESNNEVILIVRVLESPIPDLSFEVDIPLTYQPLVPLVNQTIDIQGSFNNSGRAAANSLRIEIKVVYDNQTSTQLELIQFNEIGEGQITEFMINWTPDRPGPYNLIVELDIDDEEDEIYEDNNLFQEYISINPRRPELTWDNNIGLTVIPEDNWLRDKQLFSNHSFQITGYIINEDPEVEIIDIQVDFFDFSQKANESFYIGSKTIFQIPANTTGNPLPIALQILWQPRNGTQYSGNHTLTMVIDPLNEIPEWDETDNVFNYSIKLFKPKPDLIPLALEPAGPPSDPPAEFIYSTLNLTLANYGSEDIIGGVVYILNESKIVISFNVTISEGTIQNFSFEYFWPNQGYRTLTVSVDPTNIFMELDENNTIETLIFVRPRQVEFGVVKIEHPPEIFQNQPLLITAYIQNFKSRIDNIDVELFIDNKTFDRKQIPRLDNKINRSIQFIWNNPTGIGEHTLRVHANISAIMDKNLSNNVLTSKIIIKEDAYQLYMLPFTFDDKYYVNESIILDFTIVNFGSQIVENTNVSVRIDNVLYTFTTIGPIPANNGQYHHLVQWKPIKPGEYNFTVEVDPENIIDESDESDNQHTAQLKVHGLMDTDKISTPTNESLFSGKRFLIILISILLVLFVASIITYKLKTQASTTWEPNSGIAPQPKVVSTRTNIIPSTEISHSPSKVCLECLKPVTSNPRLCACGKIYHLTCATNTGRCHSCGENLR